MKPLELYHRALELGLRLEPAGDMLAVLPKGKCPPDFADLLRQHKAELLSWLSRPPCPGWQFVPPADMPLNPVQPRPTPANARRVMAYIVRQIGDTPGPLCEWCLNRELGYWETYRWPDHVCAYAAVRDAACWQLSRDEAAVWQLLQGFDEAATRPLGTR
jgi:hypothetical protein